MEIAVSEHRMKNSKYFHDRAKNSAEIIECIKCSIGEFENVDLFVCIVIRTCIYISTFSIKQALQKTRTKHM